MDSCEITDASVASLTDSLHMNSSLLFLSLYRSPELTTEGMKPLLDVASRKAVIVSVDHDNLRRSSTLQKSRYPGLEEASDYSWSFLVLCVISLLHIQN